MFNIQVGKCYCEHCGKDCTRLWGSRINLRSMPQDKNTFEELSEIEKEYGQKEYFLCIKCSLKLMGVKTLAEKKEIEEKNKQTVENSFTTFEVSEKKKQ